jgi:hypothetical protein
MSLPGFSVRQVVLVNLLFILLMVAGVQIARRIPVDLFPDISFNTALVRTVWPGASPQEIERLVTKKIEDEIEGIAGVKEILSYSRHSLSEIDVEWDETLSDLEYEGAARRHRSRGRSAGGRRDADTPGALRFRGIQHLHGGGDRRGRRRRVHPARDRP